jgi:hypothetical protein
MVMLMTKFFLRIGLKRPNCCPKMKFLKSQRSQFSATDNQIRMEFLSLFIMLRINETITPDDGDGMINALYLSVRRISIGVRSKAS